jgi:uncharacterized protein YuzE
MQIHYDAKTDLLYLRLDDEKQPVVNRRVSEDIVLDIGSDDRVVAIEILDASRHVRMEKLLPVTYGAAAGEISVVRKEPAAPGKAHPASD